MAIKPTDLEVGTEYVFTYKDDASPGEAGKWYKAEVRRPSDSVDDEEFVSIRLTDKGTSNRKDTAKYADLTRYQSIEPVGGSPKDALADYLGVKAEDCTLEELVASVLVNARGLRTALDRRLDEVAELRETLEEGRKAAYNQDVSVAKEETVTTHEGWTVQEDVRHTPAEFEVRVRQGKFERVVVGTVRADNAGIDIDYGPLPDLRFNFLSARDVKFYERGRN
jgi:hypothetical protein